MWFLFTDQAVFTTDQLYPLQKVDLKCNRPDSAVGQIKWTMDNKDLAENTKYSFSIDKKTLTMLNASEDYSGERHIYLFMIYFCLVYDITWQNA